MEREGCAKPVQPHSPRLGRSYASWSTAEAHVRPRGGAYICLPTQGEHTKEYLKGLLAELQNATADERFREAVVQGLDRLETLPAVLCPAGLPQSRAASLRALQATCGDDSTCDA